MRSDVRADPFYQDASVKALRGFDSLKNLPSVVTKDFKAVVIGGGTGAPVSIKTLLSLGCSVDAVVAMADDGGSTGLLRQNTASTAPGDIRKVLAAFAQDSDSLFARVFQTRFGFADGHALGNLLLSAMEDESNDFMQAVEECERLLGTQGKVFPSTLDSVLLEAKTIQGESIYGQDAATCSQVPLYSVAISTPTGTVHPYEPALRAINSADLIVLGPGSFFTSIISALAVPGIAEAIQQSSAQVVFVSPMADDQGETRGMSVIDDLHALERHGLNNRINTMIVNTVIPGNFEGINSKAITVLPGQDIDCNQFTYVSFNPHEASELTMNGMHLILGNLANPDLMSWHSPVQLRNAFERVIADVIHR